MAQVIDGKEVLGSPIHSLETKKIQYNRANEIIVANSIEISLLIQKTKDSININQRLGLMTQSNPTG